MVLPGLQMHPPKLALLMLQTGPKRASASSFTVSVPTRVFDDPYRLDAGGVANYDISPDGRRFVMVEEPRASNSGAPATSQIRVVLNCKKS
jgi:hypothetical protein